VMVGIQNDELLLQKIGEGSTSNAGLSFSRLDLLQSMLTKG